MTETWFFAVAVVIGAIVLAAVLWIFIRATVERSVVLSTTLTLVGFALVSTPLWGSIAIKGPQWEITLLRQTSEKQLETILELLQALQKSLPPDKAAQISPEVNRVQQSVNDLQRLDEERERVNKIQEAVNAIAKITGTIKTILP
jgi:hypothetical protein